jgi:hypothetical protein
VISQLPGAENYSRLPPDAENKVRKKVWNLSRHSAGIGIRFRTNSPSIRIKWELIFNGKFQHITPIATGGFDLYSFKGNQWQFVGIAKPNDQHSEYTIADKLDSTYKEFLLNLPLYDGVEKLEIGIQNGFTIDKPDTLKFDSKPIVIYGTSITQGASASRSGMTYAALLSRHFNKSIVNLGFSGNGLFEPEIGEYIMSCNPEIIILDCTPNSRPYTIRQNLPKLVEYIRKEGQSVPIMFIESIIREDSYFKTEKAISVRNQNEALLEVYDKLPYHNLYYLKADDLIGTDHEGTIDGTHLNDVGHYRMFQVIMKKLYQIR